MKLNKHIFTEKEKLSEFDRWITPSLGDIKDSIEFSKALAGLEDGFNSLSDYTNGFSTLEKCSSYSIAEKMTSSISQVADIQNHLANVFNAILLSTGKTDNNLKCQYPLVLNKLYESGEIPACKNGELILIKIPRVFDLDKVIKHFEALSPYQDMFAPQLKSYLDLLLSDEQYVSQLYSLGISYCKLKENGDGSNLLASIAIFQSRGSITAKAGHEPERRLRSYMADWGLNVGTDYNNDDIDIYELLGIKKKKNDKARKYDFIVPFRSKSEGKKLFVQCQFYAGDSGSVSHKVVDQTDASRKQTLKFYPNAVFVEYLDGAGYFSSLNGDLKKMLAKKTTKAFFQVRTAPVKFRRELQEIDFLTPLEIEHAILAGNNTEVELVDFLQAQGYDKEEIYRSIGVCKEANFLHFNNYKYAIKEGRRDIIIKYCFLDCIANFGHSVNVSKEKGILYVPGFSNNWGMSQTSLLETFNREFPDIELSAKDILEKIEWLIDNEFVILK
ncbi:MAG: hypothetical protein IJT98_01500 [Prevotella sp.]|nr:hypothetical protein [Prevotella sp.]